MSDDKTPKTNYSSNSHKSKGKSDDSGKDRTKLERIVVVDAVQRKKPLSRKIAETFAGDDARSVGGYILFDVVIPAVKDLIVDSGKAALDRLFYGESKRGTASSFGQSRYTSYNLVGKSKDDPREISYKARSSHDFDEIVIKDRGEAEQVLDTLGELIANYDVATVSDLYDLVGITGSYTDDKWGWSDIRGAEVRRIHGGYLLDMPKPHPLK